jgi:hypothetical protein
MTTFNDRFRDSDRMKDVGPPDIEFVTQWVVENVLLRLAELDLRLEVIALSPGEREKATVEDLGHSASLTD